MYATILSMKDDLIRQLKESRREFLSVLLQFPDEGTIVGKWGKKEIIAHIAGWEEEGSVCIPQILKGEKPKSFLMSIKRYNDESVTKRKGKAVNELLVELKKFRESFISQIKKLSDEQLKGYYGTFLHKKPINVLWIIHEAVSHDKTHTKQLQKLLKKM